MDTHTEEDRAVLVARLVEARDRVISGVWRDIDREQVYDALRDALHALQPRSSRSTDGDLEPVKLALADLRPGVFRTCDMGRCIRCGDSTSSGSYTHCHECAWQVLRAYVLGQGSGDKQPRLSAGRPEEARDGEAARDMSGGALCDLIVSTLNGVEVRPARLRGATTVARAIVDALGVTQAIVDGVRPPTMESGEVVRGWTQRDRAAQALTALLDAAGTEWPPETRPAPIPGEEDARAWSAAAVVAAAKLVVKDLDSLVDGERDTGLRDKLLFDNVRRVKQLAEWVEWRFGVRQPSEES